MKVKTKKVLLLFTVLLLIFQISLTANTRYGRLTGVNWFGFETGNYVVHGIWSRDYRSVLQQIADLGFNCIRLPWSNAMLGKTPSSIQINEYGVDPYTGETGMNLDLEGLSSLEVMDKIIDHANTLGLKIILDCHSRAADGYAAEPLWYTAGCSEQKWIDDWCTLIRRYQNRANVIGADLNNEPHGNTGQGQKPPATWGYNEGSDNTDWKAAAEKCGKAISAINPNILIIVEGTEEYPRGHGYWWGGNLKGVADHPITSLSKNNLVYSAHEYGSSVFNQTWFSDPNFPNNMKAIWDEHFGFIRNQNIAPLFFGEFGITGAAASNPGSVDYKWFTTFMNYMGRDCSWTFWSFNPNSGDTGGLLQDDWVTVNTAKYNLLKPYLAGNSSTPVPTRTRTAATPPARTPTRTATPITTTPGGTIGDVNSDGIVNIVDALMIAQYSVGLNPAGFNTGRADVNRDGTITIVDALMVAQYSVGLIQL